MENITYLVNTCDKYLWCLDIHFDLLKKFWPDFNLPIAINAEMIEYSNTYNQEMKTILNTNNVSWSRRLKEALEAIDTEYVLMVLDDFFITSSVNTSYLEKCFDYFRNNDINALYLYDLECKKNNYNENFYKIKNGDSYCVNCQIAFWKKNVLTKLLRDHENIWNFESYGSRRAKKISGRFLCIKGNLPIPYDYKRIGVIKGKLTTETVIFLEKQGLYYDFTKKDVVYSNKSRPSKFTYYLVRLNPLFIIRWLKNRYLSLK